MILMLSHPSCLVLLEADCFMESNVPSQESSVENLSGGGTIVLMSPASSSLTYRSHLI